MPVAAVGAAAFAGAEIATVGLAAMSTFEAVAAIGAVTAGVGAITGEKDLMKMGALMGAVGGVGAFATSQGWIGGAADIAGDAGYTAAAGGAGEDATGLMDTASDAVSGSSSSAEMIGGAGKDLANADPFAAEKAAYASQDPGLLAATPPVAAPVAPPAPPASVSGLDAAAAPTGPNMSTYQSEGSTVGSGVSIEPATPDSMWGSINKWLTDNKDNKMLAGLLKVGGDAAGSFFGSMTDESKLKIAKLKAEAAQSNAYASLLSQRVAIGAAPAPVASAGAPRASPQGVTGSVYNPTGLMNA